MGSDCSVLEQNASVHVRVLGPLEVAGTGGPLLVRRGRAVRLLLSLVLREGRLVSVPTLVEEVWPDVRPVHAANALQGLVSHLRRLLADQPDAQILTAPGGYRLSVPPQAVDLIRFRQAVLGMERQTDPVTRLLSADTALSLWRGEPLAEVADEPHARATVAQLHELRLTAVEHRAGALLELGRHREAVHELSAQAVEQPYREHLHALHALALYRSGRQADALAALALTRRALRDDLGLDPGPELRSLESAVLAQSPRLEWAGAPVAALVRGRWRPTEQLLPEGA